MYMLTFYQLQEYGMDVRYQTASESESVLHEAALQWAVEAGIWDIEEPTNPTHEFQELARFFGASEEPDNPHMRIRPAASRVFVRRNDDE